MGFASRQTVAGRHAIRIGTILLLIGTAGTIIRHRPPRTFQSVERFESLAARVVEIPGATVDLAGVSLDWYGSMNVSTWRSNGQSVIQRDWTIDTNYTPQLAERMLPRRFAIRVRGNPPPPRVLSAIIDGRPAVFRDTMIRSRDSKPGEWIALSQVFDDSQWTTTVRILLATGEFHCPLPGDVSRKDGLSGEGRFEDAKYSTGELVDRAGHATVAVHWTTAGSQQYEYRVRALDRRRQWYVSSSAGTLQGATTVVQASDVREFPGLESSEISEIVVERRPAYWVEFNDVALYGKYPKFSAESATFQSDAFAPPK